MFEYRSLLDRPLRDPLGWDELFRGVDQFLREFDRETPISSFGYAPARVTEEDDKFVLQVEAPGVEEKDVRVDLNDGVLTVTAERAVTAQEGYAPRRRERAALRFSRSYALGDRLDPEKTIAELKDGVLTVSVGKSAAQKKRSITIKTA